MAIVRVLLVDDVKLFLEFERTFFERTGCQILTAASGEEAIGVARSERPHIILLDYEMPGKKGDEVCRTLKSDERTKHIPILVVTTFGGDDVKERCLAAGAAGFLAKPVSGRELLERVVDILQIPYRVFMRTPLSMEISLLSAGIRRKAQGYSEDLSETGMLAELTEYIARGSVVSVEFNLPGSDGPVRVDAEVVRTFEKRARGRFGIGLRFTQVSGVARRRIREFVKAATR